MNYRKDKYGNDISILGFGCMRFPRNVGLTDMKETEREILAAIKGGINYFDTAFIYPGSESALGEILAKHGLRQQVNIATKLPHYLIKSINGLEKMFQEQLKRLQTDYIDYYLMHMLSDVDTWKRLVDMGILEWLAEKQACGTIRQVGFSYHGNSDMFCKLLDAHDWDMALVQYNYMDEHTQAGRRGVSYAASKGIPIFIMEPLRGGKLVKRLPEAAKKIFADYPVKHSPAQWSFRWLWNQPEVTCVLSGMNSMEMLADNMNTASTVEIGELGPAEEAMLHDVVNAINAKMKVGCTGCGYCMPCPMGVDIPGTFAAYNRRYTESKFWGFVDYAMCTALRKNSTAASSCIGCGKCEQHCPQAIEIREELNNVVRTMEGPVYKVVRKAAKILKF
ncbi:MAG: aldo/keto reductase [Firmicutes bacterium]|nr:aldo/keto reductase [Bacillota bacterium]